MLTRYAGLWKLFEFEKPLILLKWNIFLNKFRPSRTELRFQSKPQNLYIVFNRGEFIMDINTMNKEYHKEKRKDITEIEIKNKKGSKMLFAFTGFDLFYRMLVFHL